MNEGQFDAVMNELIAMRMVLVHVLARQTAAERAAISDSVGREMDEHSPNVEKALMPFRRTIDEMFVQAEVVSRRRNVR